MKISRVEAHAPGKSYKFGFEPHTVGLSLFAANDPLNDDHGLAEILSEALYGVASSTPGQTPLNGEITLQGAEGHYRIRRQADPSGPRLMIAATSGRPADRDTIERLTYGLSPALLGRVFSWRRHDHHLLSGLLSDEVADLYHRATTTHRLSARTSENEQAAYERCDQLSAEIESLLAERRRASGELEQAAAGVEAKIAAQGGQRQEIERRLHAAKAELEEVETRLRYHSIAAMAEQEVGAQPPADWAPQLDDIEAEITRWRATLADLEHREATLRSELAQVHPDDGSPALPLADQRAAIAVAARLTRDIESEVARLARATGSDACVCHDAHPRLNPLVDTLGQQLRRLLDLADQQEQAVRVQQLQTEADHVARSQQDLRQQLDHLLSRRQDLWRSGRPKREAAELDHTIQESFDADAHAARRSVLQQQVAALVIELDAADHEFDSLCDEREAIARRRTTLLTNDRLPILQRELDEAERRLRDRNRVAPPEAGASLEGAGRWRASELFAKLTDGRFRSLGLFSGGRDSGVQELVAIDRHGVERVSASLGDQDRDLAAASLMIAMAAGLAQRGVELPMIFNDPFAMLDDRHTAIFANLLDDFAREGHQVLVITGRVEAIQRFAALGVLPLGRRSPEPATNTTPAAIWQRPQVTVEPAPASPMREHLLDFDDPIDRFPAVMANRTDVFARARVRTIGDLLSADPSALAEELDRDDVTAELVALWQTHLSLVCFVPGATFDDAIALTAVGIHSPEDLRQANAELLHAELEHYLQSEAGGRLLAKGYSTSLGQVEDLIARGEHGVEQWKSTDHWSRWARHRGERRQRVAENASRRSRLKLRTEEVTSDDQPLRTHQSRPKTAPKRRFYLDADSPIVDAPAIGPKTADRLEKVGVNTVDDLLEADAASLAAALDMRRVDAEKIVAWQHQAQLVCRIPMLRGHDAQILVASGFTAPEEIASMKPSELLEFVEPFASSADGQRVLRNASPPDLEEVTNWIMWARESRALDAA